ncbi:DinB family protein [Bacillus horti]|uniref:Damage-inducible protein DinB n=1 Tax=Caldalkalibacillus horti TaxID=77523 RepID=A0ABT9VXZ0_9BACI|nr:DinB family protein [Bacillus horti]MDQ0165863.1 putative damage-inducible protein DinB [Bacillus horti]
MYSNVQFLIDQRVSTWEKYSWFPTVFQVLEQVTVKEAAWQPEHGGNSIWQILHHMNYYNENILEKITGQKKERTLVKTNEETFKNHGDSNDLVGWQETLDYTGNLYNELKEALSNTTDTQLEELEISQYLANWSTHDAFHLGQIVILLREQGKWTLS